MELRPTTLLHFSGGQDSTYCLYHYLKNHPNKMLLVHHVCLRHNKEDRLDYELQAVNNILNWLRANGLTNFVYHQSSFDYGTLPRISVKDIQIVALFTGIILRTKEKDFTKIKKILMPWHKGEVNSTQPEQAFRVKAMLRALDCGHNLEYIFPIKDLRRAEMAAQMPTDLLRLVHCCRRPTPEKQWCGQCKTCLELRRAKLMDKVVS